LEIVASQDEIAKPTDRFPAIRVSGNDSAQRA
jgi:pyridoxine kinase